jgi:hypothetical protein
VTLAVVTVNEAVVAPAATVTLDGTEAAPAFELESETTAPPDGAALVKVTVPRDVPPPATLVGLSESDASDAAGGGGGGGAAG